MKREDVKALLGDKADDAIIDKIMAMNGQDIEKHKALAETAKTDLDTIKGQLADANTQIEGFKKLDVEGVKKAADDWKLKYDQEVEKHTKETEQRKFDTALEKGLTGAKVKDVVAVKAHLKLDGLKLNEDGFFVGLKEQLEPLQKEKSYLFEPADGEDPLPAIVASAQQNNAKLDPVIAAARLHMGLPATPPTK